MNENETINIQLTYKVTNSSNHKIWPRQEQYQFLSMLPSPEHHNKHTNIQQQFLSILPSSDPTKNTLTFGIGSSPYCTSQTLTKTR
jgi:hypothetical protein